MDDTVFDDFENNPPENGEGDGEEQPESGDLLNQAETKWIDDDADYETSNRGDLPTIGVIGTSHNIKDYVNSLITRNDTFRKGMADYKRRNVIRLIKSFIAVTDGDNVRPLLNNGPGLRIIHGVTFSRGGSVKLGGLTTILSYNGVDVRSVNTGRRDPDNNPIPERLNVGLEAETEFSVLVADTLRITRELAESLSSETGTDLEVSVETVDRVGDQLVSSRVTSDGYVYYEPTPEMIERVLRERSENYIKPKPGEKIDRLTEDLNNTTIFDGTGNDPINLPEIPDIVTAEIAESSVSEISGRLHERVSELTEQEIREFSGILYPKGDADIRIEALDQMANEYRLKALRETDPLKERLYKNIQEVAELNSDLTNIVEKGEAPKHSEARAVFEEEVNGNESIEDLSRLERFKKWVKKNWLAASSLAVGLAGLMTTLIIGLRHNIKIGANAVGSFGRSVYNAFRKLAKKLGPVLGPMITALGSLILNLLKYGAMGLAWLASNLWVLVLAIVWMVYDRYGKK